MAVTPPTRGQQDWDDEMNNALQSLDSGVQAAAAQAAVAASDAAYARNRADEVHTAVLGGADAATAGFINDNASATSTALTATFAGRATAGDGNIQATVRRLADDVNNVKILVTGDSTAAQAGQWPDVLMPQVQALYPHRTLRKYAWNGAAYDAPTTVAAGTGATFIDWYQAPTSGASYEEMWATLEARVAAVQPDLIFSHFGHNYGNTAALGGQPDDATMDYVFRERTLRWAAELRLLCPDADVMLTSQNPILTAGARYELSNIRAQAIRSVCADLGLAYGPVLEAYEALGVPLGPYLQADGLHPDPDGAAVAAAALLPMFKYAADRPPSARIVSPLIVPGVQLLTNGKFTDFAVPPTLTGWTASNATLSKDTTNYESANGYSVKGEASSTALAQLLQVVPIRRVRGQVVTLAARVYNPTGPSDSQSGRVSLSGTGVTTVASGALSSVKDKWVWSFVTVRVPVSATSLTAAIRFGSGAIGRTCSVDRASLVIGHLPRDVG